MVVCMYLWFPFLVNTLLYVMLDNDICFIYNYKVCVVIFLIAASIQHLNLYVQDSCLLTSRKQETAGQAKIHCNEDDYTGAWRASLTLSYLLGVLGQFTKWNKHWGACELPRDKIWWVWGMSELNAEKKWISSVNNVHPTVLRYEP